MSVIYLLVCTYKKWSNIVGDGRTAGHDTMDGGKERLWFGWQRKHLSTDHVYRSNLIGSCHGSIIWSLDLVWTLPSVPGMNSILLKVFRAAQGVAKWSMFNANGLHLLAQPYDLFFYHQFFFPFFLCFIIGLIPLHNTLDFELALDSSNNFAISTWSPLTNLYTKSPISRASIGFNISYRFNGVLMIRFQSFSLSTAAMRPSSTPWSWDGPGVAGSEQRVMGFVAFVVVMRLLSLSAHHFLLQKQCLMQDTRPSRCHPPRKWIWGLFTTISIYLISAVRC